MDQMSKTAVEVDDIRKGLSRMNVDDDDEGWLGGSTNNKKRGRGRGAPNTNNNSGSGPNNNNTANNPTRGRGQSPINKDTVRKDKVKILAVAWDKDVILTLQKHPDLVHYHATFLNIKSILIQGMIGNGFKPEESNYFCASN